MAHTPNALFENRTYRTHCQKGRLTPFRITVKETDLAIYAASDLSKEATQALLNERLTLERWIETHPHFATRLTPDTVSGPTPQLIRTMIEASAKAGVGPMASVAGALAQSVGQALMPLSPEVIVENGGDTFLSVTGDTTVALHAGDSPFSMKIGLRFKKPTHPFSLCTSSGTLGHSLSFGKSDAVTVVAPSAALADAAATAIGNKVGDQENAIDAAIAFGKEIEGVTGIVVIKGDRIGLWGEVEPIRL